MQTHEDKLLSQQMRELTQSVQTLRNDVRPLVDAAPKLQEIVDAYDSVLFGKKFLVGLATVIGSLAAIGGAVLWVLNYVRHGP